MCKYCHTEEEYDEFHNCSGEESGLRKIAELPKVCNHPEHNPPTHIVLEPGVYEYTCPGCGESTIFTVNGIIM